MGKGLKRYRSGGAEMVIDIKDVKTPNWVTEYNLFRSTEGNISADDVRKEYTNKLDDWITKTKGQEHINEFRKKYGIVIDERGNELLTADFSRSRARRLREVAQGPSGSITAGEPRKMVKEPWWNKLDGKKWVGLEGHHRRGLANLGVFFDGASPGEAFEMRQAMLNENYIGGRDARNWDWLTKKQHDIAHRILGYDPEIEGVARTYDMDVKGKKGVSNLSPKFKKWIQTIPFTNPKAKTQSILDSGPYHKASITRKDLLLDYLRITKEGYEDVASQARKASPLTITKEVLDQNSPGFTQITGKQFGVAKEAIENTPETVLAQKYNIPDFKSTNIDITKPNILKNTTKGLSKTPARFLLPGALATAGIALGGLNVKAKTKDFEEDPTLINRIQKHAAQAELGLEGADIATGGFAAPATTAIQAGLYGLDQGLEYIEQGGKKENDAKMSLLGDLPTPTRVLPAPRGY